MGPADDVDTDFVASEARRHPAIEDFVLWLTVERGRSSNTLAAYGRDGPLPSPPRSPRVDPLTATDEDVLAFVHVLQGEGWRPHRSPARWLPCVACTGSSSPTRFAPTIRRPTSRSHRSRKACPRRSRSTR